MADPAARSLPSTGCTPTWNRPLDVLGALCLPKRRTMEFPV